MAAFVESPEHLLRTGSPDEHAALNEIGTWQPPETPDPELIEESLVEYVFFSISNQLARSHLL
jgi:hypothetical protein